MNEIEKMYENVGAYDFRYDCNVSFADGDFGRITNCTKGFTKLYCQNYTDCLLKQIYEICKNNALIGGIDITAEKVVDLLDIQEVE